jgi:ABC-2 type transport system ATP-binding protein
MWDRSFVVTAANGHPVSIRNLRKEFHSRRGTTVAMSGLDLDVPAGGVFGFLGPNGAGKTTTMRCLLGLVRPTSGSLRVLGAEVPSGLPGVIGDVGALVESPRFFPGFTGRLNLKLLADMAGYTSRDIDRVLEEVDLHSRADDLFRAYSLGMKQRLAVASTLLKDPRLLILDEPANGLDPAGIRDMRDLIRRRAETGSTVFVSSHILAEVQLMCDAVAIIDRGRLVTVGSVDDVLTPHRRRVVVTIPQRDDAVHVLRDAGLSAEPADDPNDLFVDVDPGEAEVVTRVLANQGLHVRGLTGEDVSLESVFLELTGSADEVDG